jgi:outer membrane protein TolC
MRFYFSRLILIMIIGISFTGYVFAQEIKKLSLEESIQIGLENSRGIHTAKMKVVSADAKIDEVNSQRLPSLNFDATYTRLSEIDPYSIDTPFGTFDLTQNISNNYSFQLTLSQPVFTGFRLSSTHKIAELSSLASREDLSQAEQELVLNIKNSYWTLFKANKIKEVVDENVEQIKAHLKDGENLFDQGLATRNDVLKVRVQLAEAQLRQIDAQNAVKLAMTNLANIIEIPLTTEIQVQDTVTEKLETIEDMEILKEKAAGNRPELKAMEYRVEASQTGINVAQSGWFPQIYLNGNYHYDNPNQRYFPSEKKFQDSWDVNVTLSFDIWNWNKTGSQTEQAEADFEQAKDSYKLLKDAVTLQVTQSYLILTQAKEKLSVSKFSVEQAEENYRVTSELFKQGLILNSELLDVEVALLQAKTNYVQTLVDYKLAKANLERATGEKNL